MPTSDYKCRSQIKKIVRLAERPGKFRELSIISTGISYYLDLKSVKSNLRRSFTVVYHSSSLQVCRVFVAFLDR